ncbi:putative membrane protein [Wickerhamomyces ciferrii]|uniref:Calcium-transporting ATPase n=1 Tax=Wickerhamomyces ciferrii (strain ATCC 14091 / BCRC 22168 / CBS 111 / JCM 3599 / NBRC 0793 / NRRL Y-1031 F-60-10) TaxID=1206466 RepID=K0KUY2_WICCF|nr:uncharacterized protein BN7_5302 [Wickerhamomyces ciferrii]CCH45717.1 putative membrane protein [Wickerhamomyces ciferrii]
MSKNHKLNTNQLNNEQDYNMIELSPVKSNGSNFSNELKSNQQRGQRGQSEQSAPITGLKNKVQSFKLQSRSNTLNSSFTIDIDDLNELYDPKSIKFFQTKFNKVTDFYNSLKSNKKNGLDPSLPDLNDRTNHFGINKLPEKKPKSFFKLAWEAMQDKVMILLSVAALISFALGLYETFGQPPEHDAEGKEIPQIEWVEGVAIFIAVVIVVLVGAANDYQKELQFAKLNRKKDDREIIVVRGNDDQLISIHDLLVGDIIVLQTGDIIPADAVMTEGSCECDESALTGESHSIIKFPIEQALSIYDSKFPEHDVDIGHKGVPDPYLISGSRIISGIGKAMVTAVGPNSIHGRTMASLNTEPEVTPLQARLNDLADGITKYGILAALVLFIVVFARFLSELPAGKAYHDLPPAEKGSKFLDIVITAITVIVVAVPEGLPLAVTLALAFATTRMSKDSNLVRVLKACEIMGNATAVCSDKTGTLTENRMKVVNGNITGLEFDDNSHSTIDKSNDLNLNNEFKTILLSNISLNSTAFENKDFTGTASSNPFENPPKKHWWSSSQKNKLKDLETKQKENQEPFIGSKTETALLSLANRSFGMTQEFSLSHLRNDVSLLNIESIVQIIPFESSRKWGGLVVKLSNSNTYRFFVKGAAELVFERCSYETIQDGSIEKISSESQKLKFEKINTYAEMALRTISLAHKDYELENWPPKHLISEKNPLEADVDLLLGDVIKLVENTSSSSSSNTANIPQIVIDDDHSSSNNDGLILDGIVGIKDPLRPGVKEAVEQCERAGVTVRMVTGDNITTAKAISISCGILPENFQNDFESCIEGPVYRKLSKQERFRITPKLKVLARSSPEDKRILVETLKKQGEVVAVTGDGTNDAPALKLADVGFSMGISGTEVAREASDIILMTDDFSAIVNAIKWGRCVSISIKKFIQFQLTVNITAVILTFVSAVASSEGKSVLTAVQLLWVNLIMDTLAALALATDKPDHTILDRKPDGRKKPLIAVSTWKMILGQSCLQLIVTLTLHFAGQKIFHPGKAKIHVHEQAQLDALTFNTFVWLQFFKLWVTRKLGEADGISNVKDRITLQNLNFFQDLFRNYYFLAIAALIGGVQVMIMFVGGAAFSVARQTPAMWATAIICGLLSLPFGALIRIIPDEWVIKIFPTRVFRKFQYITSFKWLKFWGSKKQKNISLNDEESDPLFSSIPQFRQINRDISFVKDSDIGDENYLNPVNIYQKWRRSRSDSSFESNDSTITDNSHTISALTMVPTIVGGAVAGWSPLTSPTKAGPNSSSSST